MAGPELVGIPVSTPQPSKARYRPEIDGLRAFAVVAVIINHFNKDLLPSGYLGVDIFFVISGYVITSSLAGRESKSFLDFLTGFYERRIKRLVPALVVFVLITSVLICLFSPDPSAALGMGWRSLFGISNIQFYTEATDYFAQSTELNPFTHTWSLGVEEQFYLLFPFLIWLSGFGRQTAKGTRNLFIWVGILTIASLIGFIYLYRVNQSAAYFLMPPRFWEMAAGCLIFIGFQKRARIEQALEQVPPLLIVVALIGVMFFPVSAAVPATIGIVVLSAVLIACLKRGTLAYQFFTLKKVVFVGLISYSLYLWHWSVLSISRWTIGIHWWSVPLQIGLIFLIAVGSYQWIEIPFRKRHCQWSRRQNLSGGAFGATLSFIIVFSLKYVGQSLYLGGQKESLLHSKVSGNNIACEYYRGRKKFVPDKDIPACTYGPDAKKLAHKSVFYIGNSHAAQLGGLITQMRQTKGKGVKQAIFVVAGVANPPLPVDSYPPSERSWRQKDINTQDVIRREVMKIASEGDLVVVANNDYILTEAFQQSLPMSKRGKLNSQELMWAWRNNLVLLSQEAFKRRIKLILFAPRPFFAAPVEFKDHQDEYNTLHCGFLLEFKSNCVLLADRERLMQSTNEIRRFQIGLARRYSNVFVYDPFHILCPSRLKKCSTVVNGKVAYYDTNHLNSQGGALLYPSFSRFLKSNNLVQ